MWIWCSRSYYLEQDSLLAVLNDFLPSDVLTDVVLQASILSAINFVWSPCYRCGFLCFGLLAIGCLCPHGPCCMNEVASTSTSSLFPFLVSPLANYPICPEGGGFSTVLSYFIFLSCHVKQASQPLGCRLGTIAWKMCASQHENFSAQNNVKMLSVVAQHLFPVLEWQTGGSQGLLARQSSRTGEL